MSDHNYLRLVLQRIPAESNASEQHRLAHQLLEQVLEEQGIFPPYSLQKGEHGKPFLAQYPAVHINLSHCNKAVLCGVGGVPLGIDVEGQRPFRERVMQRVLTEEEQQAVLQAEQPAWQFLRFWTLKESFVKALGIGNLLSHAADFLFAVTAGSTGGSGLRSAGETWCSLCADGRICSDR